ncbi:type VII secretion protein EccB [Tomitella cavernea]|uniref:type VII secretion protein EccB n=1 Tax=Tomitella cavernea TaxID=1387982 RepID=UPI00241325A9|nr:type VII secretion protein EccB [Tomitella cavernea]
MPAPLTTRPQVNGYRFIIRRMEHALVRRDVRMLHEPMRSASRSLTVGAVLGTLVMAGFGIAAWISPAPDTDGSDILLAEDSGALYVRVEDERIGAAGAGPGAVGEVLHPALNLASARLVIGSPAPPLGVPGDHLPDIRRGPMVGIPGAPQLLPARTEQVAGPWTVCDGFERGAVAQTTVLVGRDQAVAAALTGGAAVLVTDGEREYVVFDGARSAVDLGDPQVVRALGLGGITPVRASAGLMAALPAGRELRAPRIDGAGEAPGFPMPGVRVGDVVRVDRGAGADADDDRYVVLRDGLQELPATVADLILYSGARQGLLQRSIGPEAVAGAPVTRHPLPLDGYPHGRLRLRDVADGTLCATWVPGRHGGGWTVGAGDPRADRGAAVRLVGADGAGPSVDRFVIPPGAAAHVSAVRGAGGGVGAGGPRFLVAETGVRYGIPDAATSKVLGLGGETDPAPWSILGLLPAGPALTRTDALVVHDGLTPDPAPAALLTGG